MSTKKERNDIAGELETALDGFDKASSEAKLDTTRGSVSDRVHSLVRAGLKAVGNDPQDVQVLYARGFINGDEPDSWNTAVRKLIEELRA